MYWSAAQIVAHHASNGCNLQPGDLIGTGTLSTAEETGLGSLLEISQGGKEPIDASQRRDPQLPRGWRRADAIAPAAQAEGAVPIGFGSCTGRVLPARLAGTSGLLFSLSRRRREKTTCLPAQSWQKVRLLRWRCGVRWRRCVHRRCPAGKTPNRRRRPSTRHQNDPGRFIATSTCSIEAHRERIYGRVGGAVRKSQLRPGQDPGIDYRIISCAGRAWQGAMPQIIRPSIARIIDGHIGRSPTGRLYHGRRSQSRRRISAVRK